MSTRHFLSSDDVESDEQAQLVRRSIELKNSRGAHAMTLNGHSIGMLFEKPSTRTRVSFEVAITELGGKAVSLRADELQLGRGETLQDTSRVMSRYLHGLVVRTFGQDRLEALAETSSIPVVNALSDLEHPCQALADLVTIAERFEDLSEVKLAYIGDGNNVCHSLLLAGAKAGLGEIKVATPQGFAPIEPIVERSVAIAQDTTTAISVGTDPVAAVTGASVVYTDVWTSMGQESSKDERYEAFEQFQINPELLARAGNDVVVMHCLPAHRGEEITDEVIDSKASAVWDQAENRLHSSKALLEWVTKESQI